MGRREHVSSLELGSLIRSYRQTAGLTQNELAVRAGLSTAAVRDLEQGRRSRPRRGSLAALSEALGLDPEQIRRLEYAARRQANAFSSSAPPAPGHEKGLWIAILGPLAIWRNGDPVFLGSPARQSILGLLAIDAGMSVRRETLLELLWGEQPPPTAAHLTQAHVSRLRRVLWPKGIVDGEGMIDSAAGAYRLRIADDELDLSVFRDLVKRAAWSREGDDIASACALYENAFGLWRGDVFAGVSQLRDHPAVDKVRHELAGSLLSYAEVAGELGRHDLVLRRLEALAVAEPLNERVHARLMIALAGCGRQAAALRVYENLRQRLDRDLGLYPGEELAQTLVRLLRQDIRTTGAGAIRIPDRLEDAHEVPRQLPAAPRYFTGRQHELSTLTGLMDQPDVASPAIPVVALTGMAGIGKSALAVCWAHQIAERFPDGQLFADLRGFSPIGMPASSADVIRGFLRALGVQDWRMPADIEGQRTYYRSLLATRRVLIVLDNAQDAEQIRPLLPGSPGSFVLITSRNRLIGLAASHGAHLLPVDCLTESESYCLLAHSLGEARVGTQPRAARELVSLCARLPLALCNTIARAAAHPDLPLAEVVAAMRREQGRLDTLETGEKLTSARMVFSWSHAKLSGHAERLFRLMAVHPGPDITVATAASLTGLPRRDASLALAELADGYLLTENMPGRYSCHELMRVYAGEIAQASETAAECRAAVHRVLDHYLQMSAIAARQLMPYRVAGTIPPPMPGVSLEEFRSASEADEWCRGEQPSLLAVIARAAHEEFSPHAWELPWAARSFLPGAACWQEMAQALERALVTARKLNDAGGQALAHQHLGWLWLRLGAYPSASDHAERAAELAHALKDRRYSALARLLRARLLRAQGQITQALDDAEQALWLYRAAGDRFGQIRALTEVGWQLAQLGDQQGARTARAQARELLVRRPPRSQ